MRVDCPPGENGLGNKARLGFEGKAISEQMLFSIYPGNASALGLDQLAFSFAARVWQVLRCFSQWPGLKSELLASRSFRGKLSPHFPCIALMVSPSALTPWKTQFVRKKRFFWVSV